MKRYIRLDIEFECDSDVMRWNAQDNLVRMINEDMPYLTVLKVRDCADMACLNVPFSYYVGMVKKPINS